MPWPEGSRGEHDAPLPTGKRSLGERDAPLPTGKRSLGERDAPRTSEPTGQQHLYLIFDDWELGYSIRELNWSDAGAEQRRLPPPFIRLEARRRRPEFFAAVGTKILATHPRVDFGDALVPGGILPIVDVHSRGVNFAPGELYPQHPIYLPAGDEELFALDMDTFKMLSMKPLWPPRLEYEYRHQISEWSWRNLPMPTFKRMDVTSYAVDSDGRTILASTAAATFAFDPLHHEWKKRVELSLPFSGRANFVHGLDVFVGLPKDVGAFGHLCFCRWLGDDIHVWFSKENLLSKDPAESHVGATLVYLGGSEPRFCLVECVSITEGKSVNMRLEECDQLVKCVDEGGGNCGELDQLKKNVDEGDGASGSMQEFGELDELEKFVDEGDGASGSMHDRCLYRLTTFSLSFDNNGDLTTGETCVVQCYKVPEEVSEAIYLVNPLAFWL